ncbi:lysophospholipid acyltransferase family protein [Pelagibacteraceae bacterium]|nr:lysophospholipid acyltransferase family protein [Pelagibacteraceae bacterium]
MKIIKYFFEFISIISLFLIFKIIGLKNASNLGSVLGRFIGPLFRSKEIIKQNIKTALGEIDKKEETMIINSMWSNIGRTFAEYVFLKDFKFNRTNFDHMKIKGINYLEKIKKNNETVIFYSCHFANFELMAMELDKFGIKCAAIYRPLNNFFLNPLMEYLRMKYICPIQIPKGRMGIREIIGKVKDGYSVALMVDQRVSEGPRTLFFNKLAHTTTIPAQLALKYNCKLVPISIERKDGTNFEINIHEPYKIEKTGNDDEDTKNITLKINQTIEKMIIKNPKQWIWSHNRWK